MEFHIEHSYNYRFMIRISNLREHLNKNEPTQICLDLLLVDQDLKLTSSELLFRRILLTAGSRGCCCSGVFSSAGRLKNKKREEWETGKERKDEERREDSVDLPVTAAVPADAACRWPALLVAGCWLLMLRWQAAAGLLESGSLFVVVMELAGRNCCCSSRWLLDGEEREREASVAWSSLAGTCCFCRWSLLLRSPGCCHASCDVSPVKKEGERKAVV
ncbi:hypothetical protein AABB24_032671 [Solanum stoloniferum]|uniref:Uncharacterized protein n=1 Tax=Solanum stoloniferum TaxID=62892 RepID=A0ABD2RKD0_9SOLN